MLVTGHLNYQCKNLGGKQGEIAQGGAYYLTDSLVPGALRWWVGVGNNQSIADYIFGCRKDINIGQKLIRSPHNCALPEKLQAIISTP